MEDRKPTYDDLLDALKTLQEAFVHVPGNTKGNKAKTDVIMYNEDMRSALVKARNILTYGYTWEGA